MIHKKEFYFLRHGQTDHALGLFTDQYDIPLNECGKQQAKEIQELICALPIQTICYSPLIRAKETKDIATAGLKVKKYEIVNLSECTCEIWNEMTSLGPQAINNGTEPVQKFIEQAKNGINQALLKPGPVLIVAHGGIHWVTCILMGFEHDLLLDNCIPVHFTCSNDGKWNSKKIKRKDAKKK